MLTLADLFFDLEPIYEDPKGGGGDGVTGFFFTCYDVFYASLDFGLSLFN
jgi:hypothetical protein